MKLIFFVFCSLFFNSCSAGRLRDKIKARIEEKINNQPAPAISTIEGAIDNPGIYNFKLISDERERLYKIYLPKNYQTVTNKLPLILAFHGGGGDMEVMSNDQLYGLLSKADKENYIVVFPSGYTKFKSGKIATWNAGNCCGDARDEKIDDIKFIKDLLSELKNKIKYNEKRVFAIGMSNGGMFTYRLACELSDYFKAVASVAGTDNTINCKPNHYLSVFHIHALDDDHVLFKGGIGQSFSEERKSKITEFNSVENTINKWVNLNKCDAKFEIQTINGVICEIYNNCASLTKIKLCKVPDGGHSWPGGNTPRRFKKTSDKMSANDEIFSFFNSL